MDRKSERRKLKRLERQKRQDARRKGEAERKRREANPTDSDLLARIAADTASIRSSLNWMLFFALVFIGISILGACASFFLG